VSAREKGAEVNKELKKVSGETKKVLDKAKLLRYNNKAAHPRDRTSDLKRAPEKFQKNLKKVLDKHKQL
jgi:hypothetical protein